MKRFLSLFFAVVLLAACSSLGTPSATIAAPVSAATSNDAEAAVTEARFLNMLNHNFVYNNDFDDIDAIVNNSVLALLDQRDSENEDFIAQSFVKGFVCDMYGIEIDDMSSLNSEFPQLEGFLYIIPRGFAAYTHSIISVEENEDGSFTVVSNVKILNHDNEFENKKAVTLFVENKASALGYNIIYSNIIEESTDI